MNISQKSLNYFKALTAETISNAKSGHTGSAIGASSIMLALFHDHLRFDPNGTNWPSRDRFILSAGHTSGMLYCLLHMFGYNIKMDDLKNFRKYGSITPGHPEHGVVPGVETTTGPLGQGVANAVGMAIAEEKMRALFPNLIENYTYCFAGDGCLMEGVANEACSLAGTLKLNKLILLYDDNNITIDGARDIANNEDVSKKFEAMGWRVIEVKNGNDYNACTKAIASAKKSDKPTIIIFKTIIGIGTKKQGQSSVHAYPLPEDELSEFKASLGVTESFYIPKDVYAFCREATIKNLKLINDWETKLKKDQNNFENFFNNKPYDYAGTLKKLCEVEELAGRDASGKVLCNLAEDNYFFGGTADLGPSTKAVIKTSEDSEPKYFNKTDDHGLLAKNIHFGIREHAMGSICNGIALYEPKLNVFDSTFMAFSNYMLPAFRMRAMMNVPVLSILSHDSIDIGEDGPTHQPIEQFPQLRQIIGLDVFRPGTYAEVVAAYKHFIEKRKPTVLGITKNKIKNVAISTIEKAEKGGYVLFENSKTPKIEIFATGKEIYLAIEVAKNLEKYGVRVISMPCISEFEKQDKTYKNKVLLKSPILKVAIEATNDNIWYKYVGENGLIINVDNYQFSGKGDDVYKKAGFDADVITKQIKNLLKAKKQWQLSLLFIFINMNNWLNFVYN